jgi:transcriptional regulator with XRE-family HTH domain
MTVGQVIRQMREERRWSQAKLGVLSGTGPSGVSQIETGRRNPSAATLQRIAEALGVEVRDLFPLGQATLPNLEADRRATSLQSWIVLNNQLGDRWEREIEEREREWREAKPAIRKMVKRIPNLGWANEISETARAVVNGQTALLEDEDAVYDSGEVAAMYRSGMRLYGLLDRVKPWFDTPAEDAPGLAPVHNIRDALKRMEKKAGVRAS